MSQVDTYVEVQNHVLQRMREKPLDRRDPKRPYLMRDAIQELWVEGKNQMASSRFGDMFSRPHVQSGFFHTRAMLAELATGEIHDVATVAFVLFLDICESVCRQVPEIMIMEEARQGEIARRATALAAGSTE